MPTQVPLQAIPSQTLTTTLDGNLFDLTIKYTNGVMSASMIINGVDTLDNMRIVAGSPLIPYKYLEAGNFLFLTQNYELPLYTQFNITQFLVYFTAAELAAFRVPPTFPVTASFFDPIGQLPLRFAPVGYAT